MQKALEKFSGAKEDQNAASVDGLLQTTEVMVAEAPKEEHEHASPGGGMGGMDM